MVPTWKDSGNAGEQPDRATAGETTARQSQAIKLPGFFRFLAWLSIFLKKPIEPTTIKHQRNKYNNGAMYNIRPKRDIVLSRKK